MLYFSDLLKTKYPQFHNALIVAMDKHNISYNFLSGTKDIWIRDYMPLPNTKNEYIQFRYEPSYLENYTYLQTNPKSITDALHVRVINSQLKLDGGNIVRLNDVAIITQRVYNENINLSKREIVSTIKKLLKLNKLIVIPDDKEDMTGHVDGVCRFIDKNRILVTDLSYNQTLKQEVYKCIYDEGFEVVSMPLESTFYKNSKSDWPAYINFVIIDKVLLLPIHGVEEDKEVIDFFKSLFNTLIIEAIDVSEISIVKGINGGGALNCISWSDKNTYNRQKDFIL